MMTRYGFVVGFSLVASVASVASAQTSELYLASYTTPDTYVVRNGQVIRRFDRGSGADGPVLVVQDTVKTLGFSYFNIGREYDFAGAPLTGQYPNEWFLECVDGATDGTRNWTVQSGVIICGGTVAVGDADWRNMQDVFHADECSSGIAYDPTDDTLWLCAPGDGDTTVRHYTTGGILLGQFDVVMQGWGLGIALDPADQTLWIPRAFHPPAQLVQCDKSGNVLQVIDMPELEDDVTGAEFGGPAFYDMYCTANPNSTGTPASLSAGGTPNASAADLILVSEPVPNQNGIFYHAANQTQLPFGNGFLCANGGSARGGVTIASGNVARYTYDNSDAQHSLVGFVGLTRNFQHWFRDPAGGGAFFNTSNGISILVLP